MDGAAALGRNERRRTTERTVCSPPKLRDVWGVRNACAGSQSVIKNALGETYLIDGQPQRRRNDPFVAMATTTKDRPSKTPLAGWLDGHRARDIVEKDGGGVSLRVDFGR
jgi:hypothetical protein